MTQVVVAQRMWQRRDTAANWAAVNPVLAKGEIGVQIEPGALTAKLKLGNGVATWSALPYFGGEGARIHSVTAAPSSALGQDGDFAINSNPSTPTLYGPKVDNVWPAGVLLKGPKGDTGNVGSRGPDGPAGLSAYQVAVANGYAGTQPQWVASLKGEKGERGLTGPPGGTLRRIHVIPDTDTGVIACDWAAYDEIRVLLTSDATFTFSGAMDGQGCILKLKQDAVGNRSVTLPAAVRFNALILSYNNTRPAGRADKIGFVYDGGDARYDFVSIIPGIQ